jgi:hypothetical protein
VTAADVDFTDYGSVGDAAGARVRRVAADVCDLPFRDGEFDVVAAVDLIEHVSPERRRTALTELARVGAKRVIVAVPTGENALAADRRLADFYRCRGVELPVWLQEHLANGFPSEDDLEAALAPHGTLTLLGNESVAAHERVAKAEALPKGALASALISKAFDPFVRRGRSRRGAARSVLSLLRGGDRRPYYRTIAVLDRR